MAFRHHGYELFLGVHGVTFCCWGAMEGLKHWQIYRVPFVLLHILLESFYIFFVLIEKSSYATPPIDGRCTA